MKRLRRWLTAGTLLWATLLMAIPAQAQTLSGSMGAFHRGSTGGHPFLYTSWRAGASLEALDGLDVGVEFAHAPVRVGSRALDLFRYHGTLRYRLEADLSPYAVVSLGPSTWREWVCEGTSCAKDPGAGRRFDYTSGFSWTAGLGLRAPLTGPLYGKAEARYVQMEYPTTVNHAMTGTFGIEVSF